jgi:methylenetetrahydrofolate reductase (NADPH)
MGSLAEASLEQPVIAAAAALIEGASLEIGGLDFAEFAATRAQLRSGQTIYVSHLPGQTWKRTMEMCAEITAHGGDPVPHIPVRLLDDAAMLDTVLRAASRAGVREPLLIAGDYPRARGPYDAVLKVLRSGALQAHGFSRVSLAGHPEGHPHVAWDVICQAQVDKWRAASAAKLAVTFVTQFFFAAEPFIHWARHLRASGVEARLVAGVAGPTALGRLIKLARHCGVGASLRTLTSRPAALLQLLGDHSPGALVHELADAKARQPGLFDGLHVFSLGGFARAAAWLRRETAR